MENTNLDSLPPSMFHKILSKVVMSSGLWDFGSARIAFRGFNEVGRVDHFYRSASLIYFNDWVYEVNDVRAFKLKCYRVGNHEAIYLRGMYEYFLLHLDDEGREKIHRAGERGCVLAQFVNVMLNLAFSVDDRVIFHNYPAFTRQHVEEMFEIINSWELSGHWHYEKPPMFLYVAERINPNVPHYCWCLRLDPPVFVVSRDGSRSQWKCDRCFWNCAAWDFCDHIDLTARV